MNKYVVGFCMYVSDNLNSAFQEHHKRAVTRLSNRSEKVRRHFSIFMSYVNDITNHIRWAVVAQSST